MNPEELKALICTLRELSLSSQETATAIRGFSNELHDTKRLWRKGGNSKLIQLGLALIAFPDPTISDVIGCALVAAGLVQLKLRNSTLYVEDVYKTFPQLVKEVTTTKLQVP